MPKLGMQDDPLIFLLTSTKLYMYKKSRLLRIVIKSLIIYQLFLTSFGCYCILYWNQSFIYMKLEYLPHLGIFSVVSLSNVSLIFGHQMMLDAIKIVKENAWCLKSGDRRTYQRILRSCKFLKVFHASAFVIICLSIASLTISFNNDGAWNVLFAIKGYWKRWEPFVTISHYLVAILCVYAITVNLNSTNYIICQIVFQYHILNHYVTRLVRTSMENTDRCGYQEDIYKQITTLVRMHAQIKRFRNMMLLYGDYATVAFTIGGIHLFLCVAAFIVFNVHPASNWRICTSLIPLVMFAVNLCSNGERAKDESERVYYTALECGWYNWNTKNRRAYLMFLINNLKPTTFSNTGVYDVDHPLFLFICRTGYTLFTLFMSVREKNI